MDDAAEKAACDRIEAAHAQGDDLPEGGGPIAGRLLARGASLLVAAQEYRGALRPASAIPAIDDDAGHARLHQSSDELRARGEAFDKELREVDDGASSGSDDGN